MDDELDLLTERLIGGLKCGLLYTERGTLWFKIRCHYADRILAWVNPPENIVQCYGYHTIGPERMARLENAIRTRPPARKLKQIGVDGNGERC